MQTIMRRYMQGTLDYACGIYAVINALSCLHGLKLNTARRVYAESQLELAAHPLTWARFVRNETDHYWLVRYMLQRWLLPGGALLNELSVRCPFEGQTAPSDADLNLSSPSLFLPEKHAPAGASRLADAEAEALHVWLTLARWFDGNKKKRCALLRFHRFVPQAAEPIVSHWTCARALEKDNIVLHDASSESNALHCLEKQALMPGNGRRALLRIVPESLFLLEDLGFS